MGRGEEFTNRHKNKVQRKRLRAEMGDLNPLESAAAKRRRRKGARRITEGMCYSLPTPENPFNENDLKATKKKKPVPQQGKEFRIRKVRQVAPLKNGEGLAGSTGKSKKTDSDNEEQKRNSGPKRVFWPLGSMGKHPLSGPQDGRLPTVFQKAEELLFPSLTFPETSENKPENTVFHWSLPREWERLSKECWEGCLRGHDVLATLPSLTSLPSHHTSEVPLSTQSNPNGKNTKKVKKLLAENTILFKSQDCNGNNNNNNDGGGTSNFRQLCYILPAVVHISAQKAAKEGMGPIALIVVPTMECALKVRGMLKILKEGLGIRSVAIHEGTSLEHQAAGLEAQAMEIIVGTPGRLSELIDGGSLSLSRVSFLVLDGADEILKFGNNEETETKEEEKNDEKTENGEINDEEIKDEETNDEEEYNDKKRGNKKLKQQLMEIRKRVHTRCQTFFLSSKFPIAVRQVAQKWLRDPIFRAVAENSVAARWAALDVKISVFSTEEKKMAKVLKFIEEAHSTEESARTKRRILILASSEETVEFVTARLVKEGHKASSLHSGKIEDAQIWATEKFRIGRIPILVVKDAESQTFDLNFGSIPFLVYFDFPESVETFVSRVTSVARRTVKGEILAFFTHLTPIFAPVLVKYLSDCCLDIDPKLEMIARAFSIVKNNLESSFEKPLESSENENKNQKQKKKKKNERK